MLVVFSPIFATVSKIVYGYNFAAPLKYYLICMIFSTNTSVKPCAYLRHIPKDFGALIVYNNDALLCYCFLYVNFKRNKIRVK